MGCGSSRPENEQETPAPATMNPLRRKIQEIGRVGTKRSTSTLSAKQLLDDEHDHLEEVGDSEEEGHVPRKSCVGVDDHIMRESCVGTDDHIMRKSSFGIDDHHIMRKSSVGIDDHITRKSSVGQDDHLMRKSSVAKDEEKVVVAAPIEEKVEAKHEVVVVDDYDHSDDDEDEEEGKQTRLGDGHKEEEKDDDEDEEEGKQTRLGDGHKEEEKDKDEDGSELAPGSPSFREYCVVIPRHSSADFCDFDKSDYDANAEKELPARRQKKSKSFDLKSEGSVTQVLMKKKHGAKKSFKILPKGMQMLNVKACYTVIPCSTPNHARVAQATTT